MPENIQISNPNFSLGPAVGFFYTADFANQELDRVLADGTPGGSYFLGRSSFRMPVKQLHYDGTFFWTLEDLPSDLGVVIKQWRLYPFKTAAFPDVTPIELRWQDELTLIHQPNIRWEADAFAVEHYHRTFENSVSRGSYTIRLNSVSELTVGDVLYLGPSGAGGFVGNEESVVVLGINPSTGDVAFSKSGGLENDFLAADPISFHKSVYLFNQHSFSGAEDERGCLVQFAWPAKNQIRSDVGKKYGSVPAADYDSTILSWVRGFQILELDLTNPTFDLTDSQEANIFEDDLGTVIVVEDLVADFAGTQFLKLQDRETTENVGTGVYATSTFSGKYSYVVLPMGAVVNSTSLEFDTRCSEPFASGDKIAVTAVVRDQFNFPVPSKTVQFSATVSDLGDPGTPGTFSPSSTITNISGIAETVYTPSATPTDILVDIQAKVL